MEEDIKILEDDDMLLHYSEQRVMQAIENLLNVYKESIEILELMSKCLGNIAYDQLPMALGFELGKYMAKLEEDEAVIEEMAQSIYLLPNVDFKSAEDVIKRFRNKVKGEKEWQN